MQHCEPGNFGVDAVQKGFGQRPVLGQQNESTDVRRFKKYVCSCIDSYFLGVKNGFASRLAKVHPHLGFAFARPIANLGGNERTGVNFERISFHVGHSGSLCCQMYEMPLIIPKMQCFIQNHLRPRVWSPIATLQGSSCSCKIQTSGGRWTKNDGVGPSCIRRWYRSNTLLCGI